MITLSFVFSSIGVLLCMLGAFFAASGFLRTTNKNLFEQASTCWSYNSNLYESLVHQRDKTVLGFVYIFLGSVMQLMALPSASSITIEIEKESYYIFFIFFTVALIALTQFITSKLTHRNINNILVLQELKNYNSIIEQMQKDITEDLKQIKENHKMDMVKSISNRLKITEDETNKDKFESIVIQRATTYVSNIKEG